MDKHARAEPNHALSQLTHHNVEPILASYVPQLQLTYRILSGNRFRSFAGFLPEQILDPSCQIACDLWFRFTIYQPSHPLDRFLAGQIDKIGILHGQ